MVPSTITEARKLAVIAFAVAAAYVLTARLGFRVGFVAEQITTVWAPTGISIAALLLWGRRVWPAVWVGALLANVGSSAPLWTAVVIATGNTLEAVVAAWLVRRDSAFDPRLRRLRDAGRLIVFGALAAPALSASIGVATLCVAAVQPWTKFGDLWTAWWLGDALGALVVTPAILTIARSRFDLPAHAWLRLVLAALGCAAVTHAVFGQLLGRALGGGPLHYIVFPVVVIAAVSFGQPTTSVVILGIAAAAIWDTVRGVGPFGPEGLPRSLILLQMFMAVLTGTGLLLAAAMSERMISQRRRGATHGIGEILSEASDLAQAGPSVLRHIGENLGWQLGALWLVDAAAGQLRCDSVWSAPGTPMAGFEAATRETVLAPGVGLPGRVWTTGRAVWLEDVVHDANFPRSSFAAEAGLHSAIGFPIQLGGSIIGVAEFFTLEITVPDPDLLATMAMAGNQLGQFIGRKQMEAAIIREQRRTRAILDSALDAVITMDHLGAITGFNPAAERTFGYRQDQAVGRELADLIIPPDLRPQHRAGLRHHLATGEGPFLNRRVETRGYHADGHQFPIEVAIIRLSDEGLPRFTGFVRDLTGRRMAEDAIRSSEERFRTLAASNSAMTLYEQDRDLRYHWVFPQHPEFPDHNIGKTDDELLPPGEGERLTALKKRVLDSGVGLREEITVTLPDGARSYDLIVEPRRDSSGTIIGVSGVAVDITERIRTEQLLRDSETQLREAARHKDEFLAMLAHELRNPLAPIRTGLEVLRLAGDSPDEVAQVRAMMERQVASMVRLIDDLLDVSRVSSGKIHLQRRPTPVADLVAAAIEANRAAIADAGLALDLRLPDQPVIVDVDPVRLVQVLSNLLNNAAKFTDPGGRIVVRAEVVTGAGSRELVLSVIDTGIGIAEAMLPRVFDLFMQAEPTAQRAPGGLGIGLALARRIVELHGGRIEAHSAGPGTGSAFTIRLPALAFDPAFVSESAPPDADRRISRRVFIVDDNADSAEALALLVRAMGGVAETASDGVDALSRAATFAPDVIFLDIGMPKLDGYETCRRIREQPFGAGVFIIALTGWGQERDRQRAAEAGFNAHLTKPADPREIERLLAGIATSHF